MTTTLEHVYEAMRRLRPDFVVAGSQHPPDDAALDALAARLGVVLPTIYRELARNLGPFVVEARPEVWPEPEEHDASPHWSDFRGIELYAIAGDAPPELDVEEVRKRLTARTGIARVVVLRRVGDPLRWTLDPDGLARSFDPRDGALGAPEELADVIVTCLEDLRQRCDRVKRALEAHGESWRART
ncbi:hypothetical protein [Sandaracinus amylolyticus]|uniref:hypothetical protein n=1 Tax=Sandaracinus amylolyticus TaxID=927083 RepID=UPI001F32CB9B|nr:hypothetical protein [Sandaracinus amylolyticus]